MFSFRGFFKLGSTSYTELAKRVYRKVVDDDCSEHAAAMAYYFMFALFPFFLFLITLIATSPSPNYWNICWSKRQPCCQVRLSPLYRTTYARFS